MNDIYKKRVISQIALILSVLVCIVGIKIIGILPDELDVEYIQQNFIASIENFTAEKTETMMYLASIVLFPVSYLIFNNILILVLKNSNKENLYSEIYTSINISMLILLVVVTILACINQPSYFTNGKICTKIYLVIPFLVLSFAMVKFSQKIEENKWYKAVSYVVMGVIIATVGYLYVDNVSDTTRYQRVHFDAYFYPVLKINSGLTPGVDFNSIYGYYSYVLAFLMLPKMYSALLFNLIMAVLVAVSLVCISIFINKFIKNKVIAIYSLLMMIYFSVVQQLLNSSQAYLQYMPHRVIFPALLMLYIIIYLKHINSRKKELFKIGGFLLSALAIFWNIDTGIVVLGTWFIIISYETLMTKSLKDKKTYLELVKHILMAIGAVIIYLLLINLFTVIRTGNFVGIKNLIYGQSNFIGSGYYMIKMELWHPWLILATIYIIGLVVALMQIKKNRKNISSDKLVKYIAILALTILGCGLFTYYQGRSHNFVFCSVLYPAIILVGIYLDYLIHNLSTVKGINKALQYVCIVVLVTIFSIIALSTLYNLMCNDKIAKLYDKENRQCDFDYREMDKLNGIIENLQYLGENEAYFYIRYRRPDIKKMPGYIDLFTYEDCKKIVDVLDETNNLYVDGNLYDKVLERYPELYDKIQAEYMVYTNGNTYVILDKEKYNNTLTEKLKEMEFLRVE